MPFRIACLAAALCCAPLAQAATMSKDAYKAQQVRIEAGYDAAQARCKARERLERDVCNEQARAGRDVQMAELELQYEPTPENDEKLRIAKAEAVHAVATVRCKAIDNRLARDICRKDARAVLAAAIAEAKLQKQVVAHELRADRMVRERQESVDRQAEAMVAAARERCGRLPEEGRANCLLDVQRRFGLQ